MSGRLTRAAYEKLIAENIEWLLQQPRSLEREHIEAVLRCSAAREYGDVAAERAAGARDMRERAAAVARDAAADWPSARERSVLDDAADRIAALPLEAPKVSP